ncbi:unnamed protein product [Ranitomeya imitator]|uniref:UBA domain-containing protein n=1 Tax=Ranitomeya imitator TaxID=111125 RepID=A0ABN9M9C1_9NEOB|nr:unnamed protein product [Ranitomeya imitator]
MFPGSGSNLLKMDSDQDQQVVLLEQASQKPKEKEHEKRSDGSGRRSSSRQGSGGSAKKDPPRASVFLGVNSHWQRTEWASDSSVEKDKSEESDDSAASSSSSEEDAARFCLPIERIDKLVFKLLGSRESLEQIVVATPGLSSDPVAMGVLQDKDLFTVFTDPSMLDTLVSSHPALVNAIILILHSVTGSSSLPPTDGAAHTVPPATLHMPGGFLFDGLSDEEDEYPQTSRSGSSSSTSGPRPASLGYTGASGPRPITQSELATALALASTPESSSHTPTPGTQGHSSGTSPMSSSVQSGTPITNDLFSQALQHALQASSQTTQQSQWQPQLQQLRDMGIRDEELSLRALQATGGDIQAALELIFAGGAL